MQATRFELAQANLAHMRARLEDPITEGFRVQLERINAVADASPGFVWRLQTDQGDATAIRRRWFVPMRAASLVLWWIPAGHRPTIDEAKARLALLEARGATADAFTFRRPFPPPGQPLRPLPEVDAELCERAG